MVQITVNQSRVRLGKLVEKVFTKDFKETYEMMAPQLEKDADSCLVRFLKASDAYIKVVADHLSNPAEIELINQFVYPPVVFCIGLRYHLLTMTLIGKEQSEKMEVPESDREFFTYMLIDCLPLVGD